MEIFAVTGIAVVAIAILAILLWRKERQLEQMLRNNYAERANWESYQVSRDAAAEKERSTLIAHIQRPDLSPTIAVEGAEPTGELLHVPYDDDVAHDEYMEQRAAGEVR